jgi:hypothetical protein
MALSGAQITRIGVMGAPGMAYAGFVAKAESEIIECTFAALSIIQSRGQSVLGAIIGDGVGVLSSIQASKGLLSIVQSRGKGVSSPITSDGESVESTLCH